MNKYNKLSLAQIDADALADYVVARKKLVYRKDEEGSDIVTASNKAQDVEKVGGYSSDLIAVAVSPQDRRTVDNALNLGGKPADSYMTNDEGTDVRNRQEKLRKDYGDDLQNIKDELYTLRQELACKGFIEDRGEYTGYIDTFKSQKPKHISERLAVVTATGNQDEVFVPDDTVFNSLDVFDYIVLEAADIQKITIRQIAEKDQARHVFVLDRDIPSDIYAANDGMNLFLSYGINDEGMFKFANAAEIAIGAEENHTGLSDDTYKIVKHTFVTNTGFAYSFRVPTEKQGYVTSFEICAKAYGSPGNMICYLIDERDVENFKSPEQAAQAYETALTEKDDSFHFYAASRPLTLSSAYGRRYIRFDFLQSNNTYPLMSMDMDEDVRYVAIIECLDCDRNNYYDIMFLQHRNSEGVLGDLELNNTTYYFERQVDGSTRNALSTDEEINASDMYYHIVTRSVVENEIDPNDKGLYTFHVKTKDMCNKARIMLRIRREGMWVANTLQSKSTVYHDSVPLRNTDLDNGVKTIPTLCLLSEIYKPIELRANSADTSSRVPTIMGGNITTINSLEDDAVTVIDPVLLKDGEPVYRVGYLVSLKARKFLTTGNTTESLQYRHFVLPLTEVFRDYDRADKTCSDRLLFEANLFGEEAKEDECYNDFIVQIYWSNMNMDPQYKDVRKAQMGAIKDIAVSFNQGF